MANTITLQELKPGDIILFSPMDDFASKLIAFVTHSDVSHTGMSDYNPGYIVNEEEDGALRRMLGAPGERRMYVRRLKNAPDTSKVVDIARVYIDQKVPYPMSNLVFLGIYILAGDFIPDTIAGDLIVTVIKVACYELIKLANEIQFHDSKRPMVCSQFAAACYDQAALEYGIEYKILYNEEVRTVPSLIKRILDQLKEDNDKTFTTGLPEKEHLLLAGADHIKMVEESVEKLLLHVKEKEHILGAEEKQGRISDEMIVTFYHYAKLILHLYGSKKAADGVEQTAAPVPQITKKEILSAEEVRKVLEELLQFQETFVTPQDLLVNTTNLEDMGLLTYTQEELDSYEEKQE